MKQSLAPLTTISKVRPGVYLIWLESPEIASTARPGQFVMVRCGENNELPLRRPLSIHQVDTTKTKLALLFNVVGKGTRWLSLCQAGDTIDLFGPLGNGFSISPNSRNLLLIAGGMGIATLHFLAEMAKSQGYMVHLREAVDTANQLIFEAFPSNYKDPGIPYPSEPAAATLFGNTDTIASSASTVDGSAGIQGMATDGIAELARLADQIFACGPVPMYKTMAQMKELKEKPVQVSLEMKMGCGLGVCYGCTVKTRSGLKQVCKDGPVFDLSELVDINWNALIL